MEALTLTPEVYGRIVDHAREALPGEAVGLLGGHPDGRVAQAVPMTNLAPPGAFLADPRSQYLAERALRASGLTTLAVYHSHPGGGASLSGLDRHFAARVRLLQVVIALDRPRRPGVEVRAFRLLGGLPREVELRIAP